MSSTKRRTPDATGLLLTSFSRKELRDPQALARFQREAQAASALNHKTLGRKR